MFYLILQIRSSFSNLCFIHCCSVAIMLTFEKVLSFFTILHLVNASLSDMDKFIEELNHKIPDHQWIAGKNFESMHSAKVFLGSLDDSKRKRNDLLSAEKTIHSNIEVPDHFDSRDKWPNCSSISKVWDQGNCESSWAVAAVSAMSDRHCIHTQTQILLSPENLIDCCYSCGYGCDGGYTMEAWKYWEKFGIVTGGGYGNEDNCQPYSFPKCDHHIDNGPYGDCPSITANTPICKH